MRLDHHVSETPFENIDVLLGRPGEEMTGSVVDISNGLSALNSV